MNKNKLTVSKLIKHLYPKIGCTPPKIFKQRTRLIKLIAEASIALNEHTKVTDDPDFWNSFENEDEFFAALEEAVIDREKLEYKLARQTNNFMYYDQEEWGEHNCENIMAKIQDDWEKRDKSAVPSVKPAKSEAALQKKGRTK